jgi:alpha-galactosidase
VFRATTPDQNLEHSLSDELIRQTADALVEGGFAAAGYKIVWIDDAWASKERDVSGALVPDPKRWPNGMKAVADYVHQRGLLLGLCK